jgi:hypothetical protein
MANEEKKVRVKILVPVGHYSMGQEVEVSQADALAMCTVRNRHDGHGLVKYQTAMTVEDFEKLKSTPVDKGGLTQDELAALGEKNIVQTPPDPAFEKKLAAAKKASQEQEQSEKKKGSSKFKPSFKEEHEVSA